MRKLNNHFNFVQNHSSFMVYQSHVCKKGRVLAELPKLDLWFILWSANLINRSFSQLLRLKWRVSSQLIDCNTIWLTFKTSSFMEVEFIDNVVKFRKRVRWRKPRGVMRSHSFKFKDLSSFAYDNVKSPLSVIRWILKM